jgi:D-alanyl-lipoteichoic acid acyltransferase DltB (MBOAT superfamily)
MVFNSPVFIFGFLPAVYIGFIVMHRIAGWRGAFLFLGAASLAFYAQSSLMLAGVLVGSVVANYLAGTLIATLSGDRRVARIALVCAIALNVATLGYFKYSNFLIDIANQIAGRDAQHLALIVPIGVSFFTFVQIGYLIEVYNGQLERPSFDRYLLFIAFFPTVTAGPLTLSREMLDQMGPRRDSAFEAQRLAVGLTLFGMGLFKKVVLADSIAIYADAVFGGVATGQGIGALESWIGAVCYALQLYFDFSGYSDMAIGLGYIFGLRLPLNFDSPFKATSISDFWRRWHITMTRFFTTYVFTPLAIRGMRATRSSGPLPRAWSVVAMPAIVTFLIAGIWHGAGWTFVVYGLIHGVAIAINNVWREYIRIELPGAVAWVLTMAVVVTGLVVFRAPDLATAGIVCAQMWGFGQIPAGVSELAPIALDVQRAVSMIFVLGLIVLLMPNTQQILHRCWVSVAPEPPSAAQEAGLLAWRPGFMSALATAAAFVTALASLSASSTFLYYQF